MSWTRLSACSKRLYPPQTRSQAVPSAIVRQTTASRQPRRIGSTYAKPRVQASRTEASSRPAKMRRRVPAVCQARNRPAAAASATKIKVRPVRRADAGEVVREVLANEGGERGAVM